MSSTGLTSARVCNFVPIHQKVLDGHANGFRVHPRALLTIQGKFCGVVARPESAPLFLFLPPVSIRTGETESQDPNGRRVLGPARQDKTNPYTLRIYTELSRFVSRLSALANRWLWEKSSYLKCTSVGIGICTPFSPRRVKRSPSGDLETLSKPRFKD